MERVETDLLILGAGGAGLCAALHAADRAPGLAITLVVKGLLGRAGCTRMVQGGYNAVLRAPDSLEAHFLVERNFRGMVRRCRDFDLDLPRRPVPVMPTAHFLMGGIVIDPDCRTALEGLFAAGEDAGGVHGANRLGGNGVADSTVFGGIAGDVMASFVAGRPRPAVSDADAERRAAAARAPLARRGPDEVVAIRAVMRDLMWERAGVVRTAHGLETALRVLEELDARLEAAAVPGSPAYNLAWQAWLDTRNQVLAARLIARSALERRESRGAHYRADHPRSDDAHGLVNVLAAERGGRLAVWTEPVRLTRARPGSTAAAAMVAIGD